ncbi:MAG: site-specific integrase [Nitrospira sp.]|nr:site-specific integrase [Nitrospira sp.]
MACVRKRRGKYVVDWRDGAGVRHWKSFDKKGDADAFRDQVGLEARQRVSPTIPASSTMTEYAEHWKRLIAQTVKSRTLARYSEMMRLHVLPQFGKLRVRELNRGQLKLFLTEKLSLGLQKRTVRNIQAVIRVMLNAAVEDGLIATNPAAKLGRALKLTVSKTTRQEEIKAMTKVQRQHFLATVLQHAPRYYPLFFVLAGTGERLGEALALQDSDLDLNAQTIRIARAFAEDGTLDTPKSGHGRTVDLSQALTAVLARHLTTLKHDRLKHGWTDQTPWLFVTQNGTPLDPANVRRAMTSVLKKAKLPLHFTPHCLRHTYASILLSEGVPAPYVQEQLGHATIELTVSTYGRWLKKKAPGALDRLDAIPSQSERAVARGSKVVAEGAYTQNPQTGAILQLPEMSLKSMEPATRIERATCGLRMA